MSGYEYKLSVVVLVYNTELYLGACLDSLVNQTLDDIEIICVNDESSDNSLNILNKYAKKYDNIKIIDQKNQGGAIAGNNGLKMAKGEYVTIIDSDDIVVHDAYEKLYKKAKETDSDIVSGKPSIYLSNFQREISYKNNIWGCEKTFTLDENLDIFYDIFYWNKIYKQSLVETHDIYMVPGKIYADAPLVFRAYLFANKISIIPDVVYYWRKRDQEDIIQGNIETSVTRSLLDIENMKDRLSNYYVIKDYFKQAGKEHYFCHVMKEYLERFFYPIDGILQDKTFEEAYINEVKNIIDDIDDIYNNNLNLRYNLYIYFIKNNLIDDLKDFINFDLKEKDTITKNNEIYWNLKYFDNPDYNIPDELFKIKKVEDIFINIEKITADSEYIYLKNVQLPKNINIANAQLYFMGLSKKDSIKYFNNYIFDLTQDSNETNLYNGQFKISDIENINTFDIYLSITNENNEEELFRFKELHFPILNKINEWNKNKNLFFHFSKLGNFSISNKYCKNLFEIEISEESMKIIPSNKGDINYAIYIQNKRKADRVHFIRNRNYLNEFINELELKWKYSLDKNVLYKLYIQMGTERTILTTDYCKNFKEKIINCDIGKIKLSKNRNNEIYVKLI